MRLERESNGIADKPATTDAPAKGDNDGIVAIKFSKDLDIFGSTDISRLRRLHSNKNDGRRALQESNTSLNIDITSFMSFDLVRGENSATERKLRYTPKLDDFSGDEMKIKFVFENPLYVSTGDSADRMVIQFTDSRLLMDPETGMFVQNPGMITELPRMLLSDDATEVLGASCYMVASATNTLIIVLILISFSLSAMTKSIWQFVNTIQLLAYMRWMV